MESTSSLRMLITCTHQGWDEYMARNASPFLDCVKYESVRSIEQYEALPDKYSYDLIIVWFGGAYVQHVLND